MSEAQSLSGRYRIEVIDESGNIKQTVESENLITTKGYFNIFCRLATNGRKHRQFMNKIRVYNEEFHEFNATTEELVYSTSNTSSTDAFLEAEITSIDTPAFNATTVDFTVPFKFKQNFITTIPTGALKITHITGIDDADKIVSVTKLSETVYKGAADTLRCTYTLEYLHPWVETMETHSGTFEVDGIAYPYQLQSDTSEDPYDFFENLNDITSQAINEFIYKLGIGYDRNGHDWAIFSIFCDFSQPYSFGSVVDITQESMVITSKAEYNVLGSSAEYFTGKGVGLNITTLLNVTGDSSIAAKSDGSTRVSYPGVRWIFGFPAHFNKERFDKYVQDQITIEAESPWEEDPEYPEYPEDPPWPLE